MDKDISNLLCSLKIRDDNVDEVSIAKEIVELQKRISILQQQLKTPIVNKEENSVLNILASTCEEFFEKQEKSSIWKRSMFECIDKLKLDYSGKVGEVFIDKVCKLCNIDSSFNNDVNSKDGTYDNPIMNKRVEIKTARLGNQGTFQHENLRNGGCDYYLFVDITPTFLYITILPHFDLNEKCNITSRKAHLRKGTTDVFKFDLTEKNINLAIQKGFALKVEKQTTLNDVEEFFKKVII